ncbi:MAG: ClpXP protease specificity-enhancing factor [Chromatiales bacterium]
MTSNRPYLIRAFYEWIVDNGLTPHLLVDATAEGAVVPERYVEGGRIVLNVGPTAVQGLRLDNDLVSFSARFGGVPMSVRVPPPAVLGVYARENGRGMLFPEEPQPGEAAGEHGPDDDPEPPDPSGGDTRPSLRVVK